MPSALGNEVLEFEDLFEMITPSGVESRINSLNSAWVALYKLFNNNEYITAEYKAWNDWATNKLQSTLSKWFASGTLNELDNWKARYKTAYNKVSNNSQINAPKPEDFVFSDNKWYQSPIVLGAGVGILVAILFKLK
jgi:hypothetical protein